ncbi:MAG: pyruvate dehydrogenase complex dihydrolipoamide acetyltransferase [Balneolales bacterium]|nr:pyruvate dehydrogenase complex dihydrolipoamide acetyltransferase [Balneolales bacterium]
MAIVIDMPKLSDTMEEGVIAKWNVKEGDKVSSGDIIAEVETDKATMDVEVFDDGTVLKLVASEGDSIPLGGIIAIIGDEGEDISGLLDGGSDSKSKEAPKQPKKNDSEAEEKKDDKAFDPLFGELEGEASSEEKVPNEDGGRVKASPLARKMAEEQGIDLSSVKGSGPNGRVVKADIEGFEAKAEAPKPEPKAEQKQAAKTATAPAANYEDIPINQMRKTIARRLSESMFTNPHFYETIDIDMKKAVQMRESLNAMPDVKVSFNDMVVKACAVALRRHPKINSSWLGDVIRMHKDVHIAVAVAVEDGLLTPVIRDTDRKGFAEIGNEVRVLAGKAKEKKLQPDQMEGSTFTISNLGMFGIEEFTAIINPPNACILAVGAIRDVPVIENGEVVPGKRMKVTLSSDHRVVDGALAAQFLQTLRSLLEEPMGMLL